MVGGDHLLLVVQPKVERMARGGGGQDERTMPPTKTLKGGQSGIILGG